MPDNLTKPIAMVGAGPMAEAYVPVLQSLKLPFVVIGRGTESAATFKSKTGVTVHLGGIK